MTGGSMGADRTVRGGIVGAGRMGLTHLAILNMLPGVEIIGVCDASRALVTTFGKQLGTGAFTKVSDLLAQELDFIVVATPTATHVDICLAAIEARTAVFVEKPLGMSAKDSGRVVEASKAAGVPVYVGYVNRLNPMFQEARRIVAQGLLGRVLHVENVMLGRTVIHEPRGDSWRSKPTAGGGVLREFAAHALDLASFIAPGPRNVQAAALDTIYSKAVPDLVRAHLASEAGFSEHVLVNWSDRATRKPFNEVKVIGDRGKLSVSQHELSLFLVEDPPGGEAYRSGWNMRYITDFYEPVPYYLRGIEFTRQLQEFVLVVRKESGAGASLCDSEQGLAVDALIEGIEQRAGGER